MISHDRKTCEFPVIVDCCMNARVLLSYTHWVTVLVVNFLCLALSNPQQLCNLHSAERSRRDQVSACFKVLLPKVKGYPCQTGWACSGGPAPTHQEVGRHVSAHAFYSSIHDPQHHARVWMSEIQIRIHCNIPRVTCMPFGPYTCNLHMSWSHLPDLHQNYSHSSVAFSE